MKMKICSLLNYKFQNVMVLCLLKRGYRNKEGYSIGIFIHAGTIIRAGTIIDIWDFSARHDYFAGTIIKQYRVYDLLY